MIKPGGKIHINGVEYQAVGDVTFHRSHGESTTRFQLSGLQRLSDGQRFYLAALDGLSREPELFAEDPALIPNQTDWLATGEVREWKVTDAAFGAMADGEYRVQRSRVMQAGATASLAPPLAGSRTLLTIAPVGGVDSPVRYLFGRDLIVGAGAGTRAGASDGDQGYYTDDTPASGVQPSEVERTPTMSPLVRWMSRALVLLVAGLVALDLKAKVHPTFDYVKLYWFLGIFSVVALVMRKRYPFRMVFYLFATAFLIYFQTLFIEHLLGVTHTTTAWNVGGLRIAGLLVLLVLLDIAHPKSFSMIAHAALFSGIISLVLYSCGFAIYALGGAPWSSYRQHVGGLPQGYIWLLILVGFFLHRVRDYRLVPVTLDGALALHLKMEQGLEGKLAVVHRRAAVLSHMADDFGDALMVSRDPRLSAAHSTYARYQALSAMMKSFAELKVTAIADPQLAEQDLATLREDLGAMRDNIARADTNEKLAGIRLSPHLLAAARKRDRKV